MVGCLHNYTRDLVLIIFSIKKNFLHGSSLSRNPSVSLYSIMFYISPDLERAKFLSLYLVCDGNLLFGAVISLERSWGWYLDGDLIRSRISVGALSSEIIGKLKFKIGNYRLGYA
jgi:hypothetical protein